MVSEAHGARSQECKTKPALYSTQLIVELHVVFGFSDSKEASLLMNVIVNFLALLVHAKISSEKMLVQLFHPFLTLSLFFLFMAPIARSDFQLTV